MERKYCPALRGTFGDWVYYTCLMRMNDVVDRIYIAGEDLYKNKNLSAYVQRQLSTKRAGQISEYIKSNKERFFNSLVIAVVGGDPKWHGFADYRPMDNNFNIEDVPKDLEDRVGFLSFDGEERMFALDGQHRLAGMSAAINSGFDEENEYLSLVFVAHKETKEGIRRTRNLFSTLNKTAVPIGKGERIALDESDAMAITTRYLIGEHPYFRCGIKFVQTDNLSAGNCTDLTTIGNVYEILMPIFLKAWGHKKKYELKYIRPSDEEIVELNNLGKSFFEGLADRFKPLADYFKASDKEKIIKKYRLEDGGHILFRPVGLRIAAEVVSELVGKYSMSLDEALDHLAQIPTNLQDDPYKDVIWLPAQKKLNTGKRGLVRDILLYIIGVEFSARKLNQFKNSYAKQVGVDVDDLNLPEKINHLQT